MFYKNGWTWGQKQQKVTAKHSSKTRVENRKKVGWDCEEYFDTPFLKSCQSKLKQVTYKHDFKRIISSCYTATHEKQKLINCA